MSELTPEVAAVYATFTADEQAIFDKLLATIAEVNPAIENAIRWKRPTFTLNGNWHHWLFSVDKTKKGITLSFHKGWLLADPQQILSGDGAHLRLIRFKTLAEIDATPVAALIREAIKHQTDME